MAKPDELILGSGDGDNAQSGNAYAFYQHSPVSEMTNNNWRVPTNVVQNLESQSQPSFEEVEEEGCMLFENFVFEEAEHIQSNKKAITCQIYDPSFLTSPATDEDQTGELHSNLSTQENPLRTLSKTHSGKESWTKTGRELRHIADEFAKSAERKKVKEKADGVDINHLTSESFYNLLSEMFYDGRNMKERIVTLFCFCADLVIRAFLNHAIDYGKQFMTWSYAFIKHRVCTWVYENGGWETVLSTFGSYIRSVVHTLTIAAVGIAAIAVGSAAIVYIRKNI
ncbi:apoptosis regulator Bcl-2-like [Limulus polyphemus]|uniref:Apoptosis regulator Bcl-2-like n=1 Tax=Limulus polyphemus TaxID=6850 RepID=A0ABM1B914_LIMPO|nr:apoptosis regulator Bcl-2-like [Limulus polyphemus]XP_013777274.1 apoptosis regulator Bcl-2-like [Limulus polyphemus]XP_022244760.1 apoptosis regulator Bcl-2-like [Limulus polyphemus]XP_022244761.1 apoptosis regulator Bcl-2-like [Limulus polyphemus]